MWVSGVGEYNTVSEDPVHAQYGQSSVTGGACSNYAAVQWYYPTPTNSTASLVYTFSTGKPQNVTVSTALTLVIDSSRQTILPYGVLPYPAPNEGYNSFGFTVLSASGSRTVFHTNSSRTVSNTSSVTGMLPQCRYDGGSMFFCNTNVLFQSYPADTRFAYMTNGTDSTGSTVGQKGAVAVVYNSTTQRYYEMASNASGLATNQSQWSLSVAVAANNDVSGGLQAVCLLGNMVDSVGLLGGNHVQYSLTLLYSTASIGTNSNGTYYVISDIRGYRTVHNSASGVSVTQVVSMLPPNATAGNDNMLYPSLPSGAALTANGLSFTVLPNESSYGLNILTLSLAAAPNTYRETNTASVHHSHRPVQHTAQHRLPQLCIGRGGQLPVTAATELSAAGCVQQRHLRLSAQRNGPHRRLSSAHIARYRCRLVPGLCLRRRAHHVRRTAQWLVLAAARLVHDELAASLLAQHGRGQCGLLRHAAARIDRTALFLSGRCRTPPYRSTSWDGASKALTAASSAAGTTTAARC